jgi:fermentation-respiration switch protein FrsA (DUF1100 family)
MVGDDAGGIFGLVSLALEHPVELVVDFRALYGASVHEVAGTELFALIRGLLGEPESRFHAASAKWDFPLSREGMFLLNLYDLTNARTVRRASDYKPTSRPWGSPKSGTAVSAVDALALLRPEGADLRVAIKSKE